MSFDDPWLLWLLPLALLPLWRRRGRALANGWLALAPRDALSVLVGRALRAAASLAIAALVVALAGPHRPEYFAPRLGKGAEIVLLLDRSRSMDQGFAGARPAAPPAGRANGPEVVDYYISQSQGRLRDSKGKVARQLLTEFTSQRPDDRFALVVFSTLPMPVLGFTDHGEVIEAAIAAGNIGRGLSETNIGLALESALGLFTDRPYTGSRIVLLVSDGGDRIDPDLRERLSHEARKQRAAIYWIYLRSANSPGLRPGPNDAPGALDSVPEMMLNRFFESLETPYRVYEAGDAEALRRAIADVNRLENLPMRYQELVPRRDLEPWCHALALACVLLLLAAQALEIRRWA
jgi:mxaC protein